LGKMPLLPWALAERWRIGEARGGSTSSREGAAAEWHAPLPADVQDYLELAAWYHSLDDSASADAVLAAAVKDFPSQALSPLVYYYLASDARRQGQHQRAQEYAAKAAAAPYAKVFPNRLEDAAVLDEALLRNPLDAHAQYFLGNFLFAHGRYEDAARFWSQAFGKGFEYSVLLRNLGLCAWRVKKDLTGAAGFYESAIRLAPNDYRLYLDLDDIYLQLGDQAHRQKLFAQAPRAVLERDTVQARRALLLAQQQQYDQALELLTNRRFKPWEGGVIVRQMFVLANVLKGRQALEAKNFAQAETAFRRALEYPESLGTGKPDKPQDAEQLFWLGEALAAQGKTEAARNAWRQAAEEGKTGGRAASLYCGLALRRLGQAEEADKVLKPLAQAASEPKPSAEDFYLAGLLDLLENRAEQGKSRLGRALELDPSLWQARTELDRAGT
jgi:tetratricopeptide (TPR) repeat protein